MSGSSPSLPAAEPARRRWPFLLAGSVMFVLGSPLLVVGAFFAVHALRYQGVCGPYAPDIGVHPCDYETYLINFFSFFAMLGMVILSFLTMVGSSALMTASWLLWLLVRVLRRSEA
jgi:hypothetical protein